MTLDDMKEKATKAAPLFRRWMRLLVSVALLLTAYAANTRPLSGTLAYLSDQFGGAITPEMFSFVCVIVGLFLWLFAQWISAGLLVWLSLPIPIYAIANAWFVYDMHQLTFVPAIMIIFLWLGFALVCREEPPIKHTWKIFKRYPS